ncbi:uncharacterized protein LY89DRAFT_679823 [Mollisia scopiformis]|uniref:Uncharacterized protein n=1 Tax=Mollisia scopiformis TaxID=149040 RepID=A0A194XS27_MOLSC|nr:uncharacterized protein LY89DRAFT_679823 [Mollisia scopiformis]KUJ22998.1 hypothetical protein LY89DRAFT_679823 [Mollisia scopiformis]
MCSCVAHRYPILSLLGPTLFHDQFIGLKKNGQGLLISNLLPAAMRQALVVSAP